MKQNLFYITLVSVFLFGLSLNAQTLWTGDFTSFTKAPNADWNLAENQDRLTDNVWITRKNTQSIFNIFSETGYMGSSNSPADTEWAYGQIADGVGTLTFLPFVQLMGGAGDLTSNILNNALVLHLISEDIYINLEFNQWSQGSSGGGGFGYRRSTPSTASVTQTVIEKEIKLFPNPVVAELNISGIENNTDYTIVNMLGSIVKKGSINMQSSMDVSKLKKGIYFIEIEDIVLKFVKK